MLISEVWVSGFRFLDRIGLEFEILLFESEILGSSLRFGVRIWDFGLDSEILDSNL